MKPKIGLITIESKKNLSAFGTNLKLINILEPLSSEITWIGTNCLGDEDELPKKVTLIKLDRRDINEESLLKQIFYDLSHQMRMILELWKLKKVNIFIYDCAYIPLFLFLCTTLFLRKKTILCLEGRGSVALRRKSINVKHKTIRIIIHSFIERVTYFLADELAVGSEFMIGRYNLQKYQNKINIGDHYVNTALFKKTKELTGRTYQVGYFGRLSAEKGVLELAQALPQILRDSESKAIIVGTGDLKEKIIAILTRNGIQSKVVLTGWIENEKIPSYLNDTKILVLPSFIEGIPNIILEAMACCTPVLATLVGGIPDVIKDGESGFIMKNNSPECIAENVIRALEHPELEKIVKNARELIEKDFTYDAAVDRYRKILKELPCIQCKYRL